MKARGTPPATLQVLVLLSYPGWYPIPEDTPSQDGGARLGVHPLSLTRLRGNPRKAMGPVKVLWEGDGYPLPERTWDQWKYYGVEMGYPAPRCGQTDTCKNSTFPSYRGGKYMKSEVLSRFGFTVSDQGDMTQNTVIFGVKN